MKVALGTFEVDDDTRKAIRKELGGKGHATRGEVKDFLLAALNDDVLPNIGAESTESTFTDQQDGDAGSVTVLAAHQSEEQHDDSELPEPGSSDTASNTTTSADPASTTGSGLTGSGYGANTTSSAPTSGNTGDGGNTV